MNKVNTLNELRLVVSDLMTSANALKRSQNLNRGADSDIPESEPCVIAFCDGLFMATWRRLKLDGSTEVCRITKTDRSEGPTPRRANAYLVKIAAFLEKRGLYAHREIITDKTNEFYAVTEIE